MNEEERLLVELAMLGFVDRHMDPELYKFRKYSLIRENRHQIDVLVWSRQVEVILPNATPTHMVSRMKSKLKVGWDKEVLRLVELAVEDRIDEW